MTQRPLSVKYTVGGAAIAVVGLALMALFALQPWRSCPEDDVAAGCRALPQDTAGLVLGLVLLMVGVALLIAGALNRRSTRAAR